MLRANQSHCYEADTLLEIVFTLLRIFSVLRAFEEKGNELEIELRNVHSETKQIFGSVVLKMVQVL
jgi:hypothetical protein